MANELPPDDRVAEEETPLYEQVLQDTYAAFVLHGQAPWEIRVAPETEIARDFGLILVRSYENDPEGQERLDKLFELLNDQ